jgi:5-methylcytosine-specific restriction endonuclease McrA
MATRAERTFVTERAKARCEYCRAPQIVTGTAYHVEHIMPSSRGGADDPSNYALCYVTCNGHKADHITGIDPQSGKEMPLFHPRRDRWERHFRFSPDTFEIVGITSKGRATIERLQMNEAKQVEARKLWVELDLFP